MPTAAERTTLMEALACLDVDLERELHRLRQERAQWEPGFLLSLLGHQPTPPPASAWTFPAAATAASPSEDTPGVTDTAAAEPLAVPEPPPVTDTELTTVPRTGDAAESLPEPTTALAVGKETAGMEEAGQDATTDQVAALLRDEPVPDSRPSWSERLNRLLARRQAAQEPVTDPWAETFAAPQRCGWPQPLVGFGIGVTVATLSTLAILWWRQPLRPTPTTPPLRVPAPPPERAVLPDPSPSPVPNLARKELPDVSAIPTASPPARPAASPNLGFYYVVMDYQNEQSLLAAQKVVPEAFVWQFPHGVKVQLAAFEVRAQAEQFVADLKAKGIDARVYP